MAHSLLDRRLIPWRRTLGGAALLILAAPLFFAFREAAQYSPDVQGTHLDWLALAYRNTLALVLGVLLISLPLGVLLAVLLFRTDLPFLRVLRALVLVGLFIPLPLTVSAWQGLLGTEGWLRLSVWESRPGQPWTHGLFPTVWVHAMAGLPWVVFLVGAGLCWVERDLEEEALLGGSPMKVMWRVTLPRAWGMIVIAAAFLVLQSAGEIAVADMFQFTTLAEDVYLQFTVGDRPALSRALLGALPWTGLLIVALALATRNMRTRLPALDEIHPLPLTFPLGRLRWGLVAVVLLCIGMFCVLPLLSLAYKLGRLGPEHWSATEAWRRLILSLTINAWDVAGMLLRALSTGILIASLGLILAWLIAGSRFWTLALSGVAMLCAAMPGPILGISLIETIQWVIEQEALEGLRSFLYDSGPLPVMWVQTIRFWPYAFAVGWVLVRLIPTPLVEHVRLQGYGLIGEWRHVVWPLVRRPFLILAVLLSALCLGEVGASVRVETPGWETFARRLFDRMHYGVDAEVAGFALTLLIELAVIGMILCLVWKTCRREMPRERDASPGAKS